MPRLGHAARCGACGWTSVVSGDLAAAVCSKCGESLAAAEPDATRAARGGCCRDPRFDGSGFPKVEASKPAKCCRAL